MTQYWGGTRHFFLLTLYNFKKIGGGGGIGLLRGPCLCILMFIFANLVCICTSRCKFANLDVLSHSEKHSDLPKNLEQAKNNHQVEI